MSTDFGTASSSRFAFTVGTDKQTDRQTNKQTGTTERPTTLTKSRSCWAHKIW